VQRWVLELVSTSVAVCTKQRPARTPLFLQPNSVLTFCLVPCPLSDLVAVMRAGQFEQIATPQDLHDRPANAFVAGFVGEGCIIPVQVLGVANGAAHLRLPDGSSIQASAAVAARPGAGQLLLRPSHLQADPSGKPCRVRAAVFRGQWWDVRVEIPGLPVPVRLSLPHRAKVGDEIPVLMTGGWLLPE